MVDAADVVVIGGGIAGLSCAARLAGDRRVTMIESEPQLGVHSSGRSAALYVELYGNGAIRELTMASGDEFRAFPPVDGAPLLEERGILFIADTARRSMLDGLRRNVDPESCAHEISSADALALCPVLRGDHVAAAVHDPGAVDVDVDLLLRHYAALTRHAGGLVVTGATVRSLDWAAGRWRVVTEAGAIEAPVVVNAAGAWADEVARMAGLPPIGIQPYRRTAVVIEPPPGLNPSAWPCVIDIDEQFYFKPFGGRLMVSPADETPCDPYDAQPEELDVAIAIDRLESVTNIQVRRLTGKWAGLRSFVPDRTPVVGFDPLADGFFWLAGQGGYGIQTAPALSALAARLIRAADPARAQAPERLVAALSPARLRGEAV